MPLPKGFERVAFAGDARPLPTRVSRRKIAIGYLELDSDQYQRNVNSKEVLLEYVKATHAMVDRSFTYRVLYKTTYDIANNPREVYSETVRSLFIPKNKIEPDLDDGDWYYGTDDVIDYLSHAGYDPLGILFVDKLATVRWQIEGAGRAGEVDHVIRPSSRETSPVEFRGMYDSDPPECCDM